MSLDLPGGKRRVVLPTEEASDFFHDRANHFASLEDAAETLAREARLGEGDRALALERALAERHAIAVGIVAPAAMGGALRRYDAKTRRLSLSEALARPSRVFQLAYQLGYLEARDVFDRLIAEAKLETQEAATLCRVGLANYVAGALLMPYAAFHAAAAAERHDIEALCHRFDVSFEQACHRLTTLQRPGLKGVPFFLVRVDIAGNIAKRLSAAGFHFSRFGGSCPRLVVHDCFTTPGRIRPQIARLPDGKTFFVVARTLDKDSGAFKEPRSQHAIAIGCDIAHARALVYADGHDLASLDGITEIGVGCRLCERAHCRQRAFPPLQHRLVVDEQVKGVSAYRFEMK
jgi:predicted transcriptional regulator